MIHRTKESEAKEPDPVRAGEEGAAPATAPSVAKFITWHRRTPNGSLMGNSRIAFDAQSRVLDQLESYLRGDDDELIAYVEAAVREAGAAPARPQEHQEDAMEQLKAWIRYETRTVNVQGELTAAYRRRQGKVNDPHRNWTEVKEKLEAAGFRVTTEPKERSRP